MSDKIKILRSFDYKFIERWNTEDFNGIEIDIIYYPIGEEGFLLITFLGGDYNEVLERCVKYVTKELNEKLILLK
jgi:hypothetical protein